MEKGIIAAAGALVVVPISIWFYTADRQPKCDSAEAVATIKSMALDKINSSTGTHLVGGSNMRNGKNTVKEFSLEHLTIDSFRKQGEVGKTGSSCAAQITIYAGGIRPEKISAEYTIEPTTDGKTMVSARFKPNS
jgi:hypothetical protein